ncbi:hypothetical protein D3C78_1500600 [compost metagenome]
MVLRDLADRTVGFGQDGGDFRQHRIGNIDAFIVGRHGDCEQPGLREDVEFFKGQDPVGIPFV